MTAGQLFLVVIAMINFFYFAVLAGGGILRWVLLVAGVAVLIVYVRWRDKKAHSLQ